MTSLTEPRYDCSILSLAIVINLLVPDLYINLHHKYVRIGRNSIQKVLIPSKASGPQ